MQDKLSEDLKSLEIDRSRKTKDKSGRKWLVIGVLVTLLLASVVAFMPEASSLVGLGTKPRQVEVVTVVRRSSSTDNVVLTVGGYIIPRHRIEVSSKISGRVEELFVDKGDAVEKGQVLARLDSREIRAQLAQARANRQAAGARLDEYVSGSRPQEIQRAGATMEQAEANLRTAKLNLDRALQLNNSGVWAKQSLDDAQNAHDVAAAQVKVARQNYELMRLGPRNEQIEMARAQLAEADATILWWETQLENTVIRAPVDGTILERLIEEGEMVTTGFTSGRGAKSALVSIANLKELEVELDINETDISRVHMGQAGTVSPDSYPDREYRAKVREISPEANRQKATIQVKVAIENPDEYLRPETNAKVSFLEARTADGGEERILVPQSSVIDQQGTPSIFLFQNGRAVQKFIATGNERWGQLEVVSGLSGGEQLIVRDLEGIADGEKVLLKRP